MSPKFYAFSSKVSTHPATSVSTHAATMTAESSASNSQSKAIENARLSMLWTGERRSNDHKRVRFSRHQDSMVDGNWTLMTMFASGTILNKPRFPRLGDKGIVISFVTEGPFLEVQHRSSFAALVIAFLSSVSESLSSKSLDNGEGGWLNPSVSRTATHTTRVAHRSFSTLHTYHDDMSVSKIL